MSVAMCGKYLILFLWWRMIYQVLSLFLPFASAADGDLPGSSGNAVYYPDLTRSQLLLASDNQCQYLEGDFVEDFHSSSLNISRWMPSGSVDVPTNEKSQNGKYETPWGYQSFGPTQDHCPSAGSVGAASPTTCTLLNPDALQLDAVLPNYPVKGSRGTFTIHPVCSILTSFSTTYQD